MSDGEVIKLDPETVALLDKLAEAHGMDPKEYLRTLLLEHASGHLKRTPPFFLSEMVECHQ